MTEGHHFTFCFSGIFHSLPPPLYEAFIAFFRFCFIMVISKPKEESHESSCAERKSDAGILDDTLFIVIADHGGANSPDGKGHHGGWTDGEKYVTFAAAGKGVNAVEIEEMNIRDLASIVLYALGIGIPEIDEQGWTSQIPAGMFTDPAIPAYRDLSHLTGAEPRISKVPHTSELL